MKNPTQVCTIGDAWAWSCKDSFPPARIEKNLVSANDIVELRDACIRMQPPCLATPLLYLLAAEEGTKHLQVCQTEVVKSC